MRKGTVLKEKRGEEEQCSASNLESKRNHQSQEESLAMQQQIRTNREEFTSVSGEKEDEKRKKVSKRGEDMLHRDSVKEFDECSSSGGGADQNMNGEESQQRQQHGAWDTLGTLLAESGLHQDDAIRDQTVDDGGENDSIVHLEDRDSGLSDGDEEENASEKVESLEWMFTRREVEKGTIEIVYRWPNHFLAAFKTWGHLQGGILTCQGYLVEVCCKTQIFRSLQELQGEEPDDDEITGAVAEEVVEDDWGSVWEQVVEEEKSKSTEKVPAGEEGENGKVMEGVDFESMEEVDEPIVELVEENGNEEMVEEVEVEEEQFVESVDEPCGGSVVEVDGPIEESVEEVINENEEFVEEVVGVDGEDILEVCNEKFVEEMGDQNYLVEGVGASIGDLVEAGDYNDEEEVTDDNSNSVYGTAGDKVWKDMLVEKVKIGRAKSGTRTRRAVWVGRKRGLRAKKGAAGFWKVIG